MTTAIIDHKCPHCGAQQNRATSTDGLKGGPEENDITLCMACGTFGAFDQNLAMRKLTPEEMVEVENSAYLKRLRQFWLDARKRSIN